MTGNRTYGALYYKKQLVAVTVEDLIRDSKIKKQTAIPANPDTGYNVTVGPTSRESLRKSGVDFGKGIWIPRVGTDASAVNLDGPGNLDFSGIRIHAGKNIVSYLKISPNCVYVREMFESWQFKRPISGNVSSEVPQHNIFSHLGDAFTYFAINFNNKKKKNLGRRKKYSTNASGVMI
jgi:hypothetical protein